MQAPLTCCEPQTEPDQNRSVPTMDKESQVDFLGA
jgi:hypothetical protein